MANYSRVSVLNTIIHQGLIPIFYHHDAEAAQMILDACVNGGSGVIEFTNRGEGAWTVFNELIRHRQNTQLDVIIGVGSVVDEATAALFVNNGTDFVVGPVFNNDIARLCNRRKVAYIPGCGSMTEISNAEEAGVELVKIFPGSVLGPDFVKAIRGPQPWTRVVVTGGVIPDEANINKWFEAGATAVGIGSRLINNDWINAGNYQQISNSVERVLNWIRPYKTKVVTNADLI